MTDGDPSPADEAVVVNHVGQCTADVDRAIRFYVELLGFVVDRDLAVPDAAAAPLLGIEPPIGLRAVYLRRGSFVLELLSFDRPGNPAARERAMNDPGLTHVSISVDDFDSVLDRVASLGGEIVTRLPVAAIVRDPDGQLVELLPMSYRRHLDRDRRPRPRD